MSLALAMSSTIAHGETIALTNATIHVRPDRKLENATLIVRDGKVSAVGRALAVPAGARAIDGTGKVITAGLIDSATMLGLVEIDLEPSGNDGRFQPTPDQIHAAFRTTDAYDPRSVAIPIARTAGVTSAISGPQGTVIAGQAAWVSLADNAPPIQFPAAMLGTLGRGAVAAQSRGYAVEALRTLFDDVEAYRRNRAGFERNQSRKLAADRADLEALIPVLDGRLPLVVQARSDVDIGAALALATERKLKIAISGGTEAWRVAKQLAAAKVAVILDPTDNLPRDVSSIDARDDNASRLVAAGVTVAISTLGETTNVRQLRQLAGIAVSHGLPWETALAAITSVPAQLFGGAGRGTLEVGSVADVVVWSGDPFELATRAELVIIGGVIQSMTTHQTQLRDRYRKLP